MKNVMIVISLALVVSACGGGGGAVRMDDPSGIGAKVSATGINDSSSFLFIERYGYPQFFDRETLDQVRTAIDVTAANLQLTPETARGGLSRFRAKGEIEVDGDSLNVDSYGAWGDHSAFWVVGVEGEHSPDFGAVSGGRFSNTNPRGVTGTATWTGAMYGTALRKFVHGDASVTYDFADNTVDVRLTGISDVNTPQGYPDRFWTGMPVHNGTFGHGANTSIAYNQAPDPEASPYYYGSWILGSFYGPAHQEVGGVFRDENMAGAFGAKNAERGVR